MRRGKPRTKLEELVIGSPITGKVISVAKFGAFVDIGALTDGLVHITEFGKRGLRNVESVVQMGDTVDVWVKSVDVAKNRIALSMRHQVERPMNAIGVGDVMTGRVTGITKYGVFVDIGSDTEGLVHVSEMSGGYVTRVEDMVRVGDSVEVKVKELDQDRQRISLSMAGLANDTYRPAPDEPQMEGGTDDARSRRPEGQGRTESRPEGQGRAESRPGGRVEGRPDGRGESRPDGRGESRPEGRAESRPEGRSDGRPEGRTGDRERSREGGSQRERGRGRSGGGSGGGDRDRGRGRRSEGASAQEVYEPSEPEVSMPTVIELALRRALGQSDDDVAAEEARRKAAGKNTRGSVATDVYQRMLEEYKASKQS